MDYGWINQNKVIVDWHAHVLYYGDHVLKS